jgi:hypothetical protein
MMERERFYIKDIKKEHFIADGFRHDAETATERYKDDPEKCKKERTYGEAGFLCHTIFATEKKVAHYNTRNCLAGENSLDLGDETEDMAIRDSTQGNFY